LARDGVGEQSARVWKTMNESHIPQQSHRQFVTVGEVSTIHLTNDFDVENFCGMFNFRH